MPAEPWAPLLGLGHDAEDVERALAGAPPDEVSVLLDTLAVAGDTGPRHAALLAARFALLARSETSTSRADAAGCEARDALVRVGDARGASFVEVERAAALAASRAGLDDAARIVGELAVPDGDPALAAAVLRVRGSITRARADLGGSLLALEQAAALAARSGSAREQVRTANTLGASYAALGVSGLARDALERGREIAELAGLRHSAAVASGQLAVLAFDAGQPRLAVRHLEAQRRASASLGDVHGEARALSLLVEAYAAGNEPGASRRASDDARALYARAPTPWTRLQAVLATQYEAEDALSGGDDARADELLASIAEERASALPLWRVVRAREAFAILHRARRSATHAEVEPAIEDALACLRRSPRPTWASRALLLAVRVAKARGREDLVPALAVRAAALLEARGAAGTRALVTLRELAPEAAVRRAMALGRDLVLRARLALAPLAPFEAESLVFATSGDGAAPDAVLASFRADDTGEPPDALWASLEGPYLVRVVTTDVEAAARAERRAPAIASVASVVRSRCVARVTHDPGIGLALATTDAPLVSGSW